MHSIFVAGLAGLFVAGLANRPEADSQMRAVTLAIQWLRQWPAKCSWPEMPSSQIC